MLHGKKISIIVACTPAWVIGYKNTIPWKAPADLARFKRLTMGHDVVMGRTTYDSIIAKLKKPLPGRHTIVVTRNSCLGSNTDRTIAHSFDEAVLQARGDEVFVAGGAEIYKLALPHADTLHLTLVYTKTLGDTHFPWWNSDEWHLVIERTDPGSTPQTKYIQYKRT
ncbi:MAG: dihydrofolate reductase [Patescibacteria group bacterium]